jgi:outer membrane protein insertion porin family
VLRSGLIGGSQAFLLSGLLAGASGAAAQQAVAPAAPAQQAPAAAPVVRTIRSVAVVGNERLEPDTVRSYVDLAPGQSYDRERLDRALKALFATDLFADVQIRDDGAGAITLQVRENPVINRVLIEGAKRVKEDKIREEIRVAPRQIFTRSRVRSDVDRILELYRRSGRFSARVEPKIVNLEQNRVDLVFEISEGPKSKIRQINIIGNEKFKDGKVRDAMASRQSRWFRLFTSTDTYDPDRLAYDQQKLRQFYLTQGYADFRVISSVAELTPDRRDFIVTYVVEEGDRYKFGDVDLTSQLRDVKVEDFRKLVTIKTGDWYNAKRVEDIVDSLTNSVGLLGYAFADIRPNFERDKQKRLMNVTFAINEAPRVYVEAVNINGNTRTQDQVIRREFRLAEGDAFNSVKVKRSRDRIQSLGFFQEKLEVQQKPGTAPDKIALQVDIEERPTGSLQVSAGYSSLEGFILSFSIEERNFRGRGQNLRLSTSISSWSKSVEVGFTEPYIFDRNLALGTDIFRRDYSSWRYGNNNNRETTYKQISTGFQIRLGTPLTEYWTLIGRYGLTADKVSLDQIYYTGGVCDPVLAGRFLCDALGKYTTSSIGYTLGYDSLDNRMRPTRGQQFSFNQDVAGLGGSVKYLRSRVNYDIYHPLFGGFILNLGAEAGNIFGFGGSGVRLTDRFYLGDPQMRGFAIRGVGPRVIRKYLTNADGSESTDRNNWTDDAIGGRNYYLGHAEIEIPLGSGGRELGLRPSVFMDVGALWNVPRPTLTSHGTTTTEVTNADGSVSTITTPGFNEYFYGDTPTPRVSVGFGLSWNSPFGPFRFDIAKALRKVEGDDTQVFQFNVGTQF